MSERYYIFMTDLNSVMASSVLIHLHIECERTLVGDEFLLRHGLSVLKGHVNSESFHDEPKFCH